MGFNSGFKGLIVHGQESEQYSMYCWRYCNEHFKIIIFLLL